MTLLSGTRLGPYEILAPIGAGGMGEVYRARDTRLDRQVAVKILPSEFSQNAQLKIRFEREAKTISQLNHPNICTLFDIGHENGTDFLVMELLEGQSLADRLTKGPIPLREVLKSGVQIAEALDRAYRAGIVHRDLKPGNVMLTKTGAKLLDFGLAKTAAIVSGPDATTQKPLTKEGTILGTLPYMAPEQLDGLEADARTDIFAFGAVLYEMATGKRAFEGKTQSSLIAAIVSGEPKPVSAIQPLTPPAFEHLVTMCLAKNPDDRWQSAHDIAEELRWIGEVGSQAGIASPLLSKRKSRERLLWSSALFAAIAIAVLAVYAYVRERNRLVHPALMSVLAPKGKSIDQTSPPTISPDGAVLAFVLKDDETGARDLVIRTIDEPEPQKLVSLRSDDYGLPFWSPDGEWIGFFSYGKLKKIRAHSSGEAVAPEDICLVHGMKSSGQGYGVGATWSKAGTILFAPSAGYGLFQVSASGGQPVAVTPLDGKSGQAVHAWPKFVPDGEHFFFIVGKRAKESNEIWYGSLDGSPPRKVTDADALTGYTSPWLVFVREATMYAQRIDLGTLKLSGAATPILARVFYDETEANAPSSMSATGTIAYFEAAVASVELRWVDRLGHTLRRLQQLEGISNVQLSPDGTRAALNQFNVAKGARDVAIVDLARGTKTNISKGRMGDCDAPFWADNDHVLYSSDADGTYDVFTQSDDASSLQPFWRSREDKYVVDVAPVAHLSLIRVDSAHVGIWSKPLQGGPPRPEVQDDADNSEAAISRDGRWLAFVSNRSGSSEAYVREMAGGRTDQVSNDGATTVSWSRGGSEILYRNVAGMLMSVRVQKASDKFNLVPPQPLFSIQDMAGDTFDTSADGQRFLVPIIVSKPPSAVTLLTGWQRKLRRE